MNLIVFMTIGQTKRRTHNKSEEPINYPAGNLLAHFKRYTHNINIDNVNTKYYN